MERSDTNSCGPQSLSEMPSHSWELDRLAGYAQQQHAHLIEEEKAVAPNYWRLGMALTLLRKNFGRGQWGMCLVALKIDKTRASKARAIFRTFSAESDMEGLSVEEAYDRRHRPRRLSKKRSRQRKQRASVEEFLRQVGQELGARIGDAAGLQPHDARLLLPALGEVGRQFERLAQQLHARSRLRQVDKRQLTIATGRGSGK